MEVQTEKQYNLLPSGNLRIVEYKQKYFGVAICGNSGLFYSQGNDVPETETNLLEQVVQHQESLGLEKLNRYIKYYKKKIQNLQSKTEVGK